ncbi:hypothetical protein NPIL_78241 [Nephila pilipes]|uniref:Uncharacterized protein n=1 Tax=Nephila pilipes TaxID=299642 RepID=A0A8X6TBW5_NEPPI|nr:hypothetical protein NPIL_78241 [Nephila pilipes]
MSYADFKEILKKVKSNEVARPRGQGPSSDLSIVLEFCGASVEHSGDCTKFPLHHIWHQGQGTTENWKNRMRRNGPRDKCDPSNRTRNQFWDPLEEKM